MSEEITPDQLKELLADKGMKQKDLAELLSITQPMVSKVFNGLRSITAAENKLLRLYFFGEVPFDMIRPEDSGYSSELQFTNQEWHVMEIMASRSGYQSAAEWIVSRIRADLAYMEHKEEIARQMLDSPTITHISDADRYHLPCIAVAAGSPITADDLDDLEVSKHYAPGHFVALVNGESMQPTITDGAHALMLSRDHLDNPHCKKGCIYSFVVNGELTLKEFQTRLATAEEIEEGLSYTSFKTGEQKVKVLHSHNPAYEDLVVTGDDFQMTGYYIKTL